MSKDTSKRNAPTERERWLQYEAAKKQIAATAQTSAEYEARIERLKERLKL